MRVTNKKKVLGGISAVSGVGGVPRFLRRPPSGPTPDTIFLNVIFLGTDIVRNWYFSSKVKYQFLAKKNYKTTALLLLL